MISLYLIIFYNMMIHLKFLIIPIDRAKALEEYVMKPNLRSTTLDHLLLYLCDFRNVYHTFNNGIQNNAAYQHVIKHI